MGMSSSMAWPGRALLVVALVAGCQVLASAHDFWIEPSTFRVRAGELVKLALRVGHAWEGEPVQRNPARFERFVLVSQAGEAPVLGSDGAHPAGLTRPGAATGIQVVVYRGVRVPHRMEGPAFEKYLAEEGLAHVIATRKARGQSALAGREWYSRCAKALIAVGDANVGGHDRLVGMPLELVPEANPYTHMAGAPLPVRVLHGGAPAAGVLVQAVARERPDQAIRAVTDAAGRVRLPLGRSAGWLVKAVHMVPAQGGEVDWESFWASLTFEIP
jgi:uncharacterized GH25 family protein